LSISEPEHNAGIDALASDAVADQSSPHILSLNVHTLLGSGYHAVCDPLNRF